jgi:hypothetical protein
MRPERKGQMLVTGIAYMWAVLRSGQVAERERGQAASRSAVLSRRGCSTPTGSPTGERRQ